MGFRLEYFREKNDGMLTKARAGSVSDSISDDAELIYVIVGRVSVRTSPSP